MITETPAKESIVDVYRVLNAPLMFCGIAILGITFAEGLLYIKIAGCGTTTLLRELRHLRFFGKFRIFFKITTFKNSGRLLPISPEIMAKSLLLLFNLKSMFTS